MPNTNPNLSEQNVFHVSRIVTNVQKAMYCNQINAFSELANSKKKQAKATTPANNPKCKSIHIHLILLGTNLVKWN